MAETHIDTPHHRLNAYLSTPPGDGPWPGVIVIHDAMGLTSVARGHADWLASEGFLAIVPDLYSWGGKFRCVRATIGDIQKRSGTTFDDVEAVRQSLLNRQDCTGKIGIIGFCMGGGFAILAASGHGFDASAPNYGQVPDDVDEIMKGACPVVASFGAEDKLVPDGAVKLERALRNNGVTHDVKEYPGVAHSYMDNHQTLLFRFMRIMMPLRYDEAATSDTRLRITGFFKEHLK
jgi:carboxymethylenebutenolidase